MDSQPVFIISRQSRITQFTDCTPPPSFMCNCVTWFPSRHFYFRDLHIGYINNNSVTGALNKRTKRCFMPSRAT